MSQLWACQISLLKNLDCIKVLKCDNPDCLVYYIEKYLGNEEGLLDSMKNLIDNNFDFSLRTTFEWIHRHFTECEIKLCPGECIYHKSMLLNFNINWICENEEYSNEVLLDNFGINADSFFCENFDLIEKIKVFECERCKSVHRYNFSAESIPEHFFVNINYTHFLISSDVQKILKSMPLTLNSSSLFSGIHKPLTYKLSGIIFLSSDNTCFSITLNSKRTWECQSLKLSNTSFFDMLTQVLIQDNLPIQLIYTNRLRGPYKLTLTGWDIVYSNISEKVLCTMPCGKIKDSLKCSCCNENNSFIGWYCHCGQLNNSTRCTCGQILQKCLICKFFSLSSTCPNCYLMEEPKNFVETCPICSEPYKEGYQICSFCLNPNLAIFN